MSSETFTEQIDGYLKHHQGLHPTVRDDLHALLKSTEKIGPPESLLKKMDIQKPNEEGLIYIRLSFPFNSVLWIDTFYEKMSALSNYKNSTVSSSSEYMVIVVCLFAKKTRRRVADEE